MIRDKNGIPILDARPFESGGQLPKRPSRVACRSRRRPFEFTDGTKKKAFTKYHGICQWCGGKIRKWDRGVYHHLIPIYRGGGRQLKNCLLLHQKCHDDPEAHAFLHFWGLEPVGME